MGNVCFWKLIAGVSDLRIVELNSVLRQDSPRHKLHFPEPRACSINEQLFVPQFATMKPFSAATALLGFLSTALAGAATETSKVNLPSEFKPPQVFKNANLVHIVSLEKNYVKEQINVLIENIAKEPQDDYFLPFAADQISRVGGFEVKDRKDASNGPFVAEAVEYDALR